MVTTRHVTRLPPVLMFYGLELKMMCGGAVLLFNVVIIMAVVINLFSPLIYQ